MSVIVCSPTPVAVPAGQRQSGIFRAASAAVSMRSYPTPWCWTRRRRGAPSRSAAVSAQSAMMRNSARASLARASAGSSVSRNSGSTPGGACSRITA